MKQKVVIRVPLNYGKNSPHLLGWLLKKINKNYNGIKNDHQSMMKSIIKAMKIASNQSGVISVAVEGSERGLIVVVGEGIDSVRLLSRLRKKVGFAVLASVSEVEKPKQETKPSESGIQSTVLPTYQAGVPYHYQVGFAELSCVSPVSTECLFPNSVRPISLLGIKSKRLVDTTSIASIFPPDRSDTESDTSSEPNESCPRFSCSIDTIFPPAWSPSQSPPRISFSIETFFPPARSPSQSDSSENYEEIFPIDPLIATSSRRTRPMRVVKALVQAEVKVQAQDGNADDRAAEAGDKAADTLFPPARSPSQSPPRRFSFSIDTLFPPARSPSQSDSSENYEEIFPNNPKEHELVFHRYVPVPMFCEVVYDPDPSSCSIM